MAEIKNIIYNATFGDWFTEHDARFITYFNPTHIALMEEVVRIALNSNPYKTCDCAGCAATHALRNYRRERGLDG